MIDKKYLLKELPRPDCVKEVPANNRRYAFAERENGRTFWCVESKEEALQLAVNLIQIAFLYDSPIMDRAKKTPAPRANNEIDTTP